MRTKLTFARAKPGLPDQLGDRPGGEVLKWIQGLVFGEILYKFQDVLIGGYILYCPRCGAENEGEARFCSRCGVPLKGDVSVPVSRRRRDYECFGAQGGTIPGLVIGVIIILVGFAMVFGHGFGMMMGAWGESFGESMGRWGESVGRFFAEWGTNWGSTIGAYVAIFVGLALVLSILYGRDMR